MANRYLRGGNHIGCGPRVFLPCYQVLKRTSPR
jgi:hypothetical protein